MKRLICALLGCAMLLWSAPALAIDFGFLSDAADWVGNAASDVGDWAGNAANDVGDWAGNAANDVGDWVSGAARDTGEWIGGAANWVGDTATGTFNNVTGAFEPSDVKISEDELNLPEMVQFEEGEQVYYLGQTVNTGKDNGFSGSYEIDVNDPHFGWELGRFFVKGFTQVTYDADGTPVFLKVVGDQVQLHYQLLQDIDHLNGTKNVYISSDAGGYDKYFNVPRTNFGRGALLVKHTNYQNYDRTPAIYTDFLAARTTDTANTTVELFEEGDYEVALNYEINKPGALNVGSYTNYRVFFKFKVRNGNCMVFPFDVVTGEELTNSAITENGFYLDLARSRYLEVNIQRQVLQPGAGGLVEDTRYNRAAKDGDQYTDEGIYTITVKNLYTGAMTIKTLFVGSGEELQQYRESGAVICD